MVTNVLYLIQIFNRLFEELKIQYEAEKVKNLNQIKQLEEKLPNLEMQVLEFSAEKRELQFLVKTSEKQIKYIYL